MDIKRFDKHACVAVEAALKPRLEEIAKELGIDIKYAGGRFDVNTFTMRIECSTIGQDGTVNTRFAEDFKRNAHVFGLEATDLGRQFNYSFEVYEIVGLKPKSRKFPILVKRLKDGRMFKLMARSVKDGLDKRYKDAPEDEGISLETLRNSL